MLELLLKAHRPEKYKDRVENHHTGKEDEELLPDYTEEELIVRLIAKRMPKPLPFDVASPWNNGTGNDAGTGSGNGRGPH